MLTNWQSEIIEYFEDGQEIVTFNSMEDCMDKIGYYLEHEEERRTIAALGQRSVRERFGYREGLMRLFELEN